MMEMGILDENRIENERFERVMIYGQEPEAISPMNCDWVTVPTLFCDVY